MNLHGKRVVITGASRGLGAAFARELTAAGAHVLLVARSEESLAAVADEVSGKYIVGDLLDEETTSTLVERIEAEGPIDILINNAGLECNGNIADQSPNDIRSVLRLNLEVPALLCRAVLPNMIARRSGLLVNMSSLAMSVATPGWATYSASKAGLTSLTESMTRELTGTGVSVLGVELGYVDTGMLTAVRSGGPSAAQFERYKKLGLAPTLQPAAVAVALRRAIENNGDHLRLPKRSMAFPMIANVPRRIADLLQRGV